MTVHLATTFYYILCSCCSVRIGLFSGGTVAFDPSSSDILSASDRTCYSGVILFLSVVFASSGIVT